MFMCDTLTALVLANCCQYQARNVWKISKFIEQSKIFSSKINHQFRVIVLCSVAERTGRWVHTKVSKKLFDVHWSMHHNIFL
jgi:TRAP-type mannitol/chloroaromatic compound transport system permease small subunit